MPLNLTRPLAASLLALSLSLALPAAAQSGDQGPVNEPGAEVMAAGFMNAHPDLMYRSRGVERFRDGDYEEALVRFTRAARFADKPSQGMLGEMYWTGQGVAQDRAMAYAWMDLAAERMWRPFVIKREMYWNELSADERERALEEGQKLYAEYGDAVAKPRKEQVMSRERKNVVGSRTGAVSGAVSIQIPGPGGTETISAKDYYDDRYWEADTYWAWQERVWKEARPAMVDVGPLTTTANPTPPRDDDTDGSPR
jgi:hypothetical protein